MQVGRVVGVVRINQREIADLLGVTQGYISKVLRGDKAISTENANRVASLVDISVHVLFQPSPNRMGYFFVRGDLLRTLVRSGVQVPEERSIRYTQEEVAAFLGMTQGNFTKVLQGRLALSPENVRLLEDLFQTDWGWLQGHGRVFRPSTPPRQGPPPPRTPRPPARVELQLARDFNGTWKLEVGERILQRMRSHPEGRITQARAAEAIGVTQGYLSRVINGHQAINLSNAQTLARFLGVETHWLLAVNVIHSNAHLLMRVQPREYVNMPELLEIARYFSAI
jgi:transcriptional regulator with XRE-family HTH domain